ncbi:hypothetical protein PHLGIDRAFT_35537 [Phlebiopsis gigantea 11061_1 CR5-6]|uniref:WSC domain-containing protein n=1 Tax=Phlebiopsis gigantea (strain 11061_1 CR5-6) TaxID=745531 RepID=A0A0C3S892_PHLG1|nr:hypothetical protein PHLGIDRAFT_35537 [Phlebiopsis gigantea 11061_1 CR5-6]
MVLSKLSAAWALVAVPLASASSHFIMGGLKPIAYERLDPIVNQGVVSSHLHAFMGANNLNANSDYDSIRDAECTSVPFQTVDKSVYWAPPVLYQDQNTHEFSIMPPAFNIYYFFDRNGTGETVHAFPQGLRMVAGNPTRSSYNASNFADQAVSFVCLDYSGAVSNDPAYAERQDINFPDINKCQDGIRYQVFFPQCWDGVNLDSADHKSHMAYPVDNYNGGHCPESHPVHTVAIFYEQLIPVSGYPHWGPDAYVLSTGDPTGLTYHADFMMGWDASILQDAVDNCHNMNGDITLCQVLAPYINQDEAGACTLDSQIVNEAVGYSAPIPALPGCNPVRTDFSTAASCNGLVTPGFANAAAPLTPGWGDLGCIAEGTNGRALTGASTTSPNMTANVCAGFCASKGFTYAGIEFGDECYCGNSFSNGATGNPVNWYECTSDCAGNSLYEKCGGPQRLELLKAGAASVTPSSAPPSSTAVASSSAAASVVSSSVVQASSSAASVISSAVVQASSSVASAGSSSVAQVSSSAVVSSSSVASVSSPIFSIPTSSASASASSASVVAASSVSQVLIAHSTTSTWAVQPTQPPAPPSNSTAGTWAATGCFSDGGPRALTGHSFTSSHMTQETCQSECQNLGFTMAGVEFGQECYCGDKFENGLGQPLNPGPACYMTCAGNSGEHCGGTWTMNVFKFTPASSKRSKHFGRAHHQMRSRAF